MKVNTMKGPKYDFTNNLFENIRDFWDKLILQMNPTQILEIGPYEGASACYFIEKLATSKEIELHCVDTWKVGIKHKEIGLYLVGKRFFIMKSNI
jgi:hypothetical protein